MTGQDVFTGDGVTIKDVHRRCTSILQKAGIESASLESSILICKVLQVDKILLYSHPERMIEHSELEEIDRLIEKRISGYPLAYLVGKKEFYGLDFNVADGVLIPRPETEIIIEEAVRELAGKSANVMDLGTGSGCIAVCIAKLLPESHVLAVDVSEIALGIAHDNACKHCVEDRIDFIRMDMMEALKLWSGKLDAVLSNPPYIPTGDIQHLQKEVCVYEPTEALDGGIDGLEFYRKLIPISFHALKDTGTLILEMGISQSESIVDIAEDAGFSHIRICRDLSGINRTLVCNK